MTAPIAADLSGRTCVVTGASAGIGKAAALALARLGARVVLACRSTERGEAALREIAAATGSRTLEVMSVDVSSQASIRAFAQAFGDRELHVLVNNAGIWSTKRETSADGIELTWATNVLGYVLGTDLLLDRLRAAGRARIVNVASELARSLELDDVEFKRRSYSGVTAYAQSKQANRMWTWALARRLEGTGVTANALHPGGVNTELFAKAGGLIGSAAAVGARIFAKTPEDGADTAVWLAASPEVEGVTGKFFVDRSEAVCRFRDRAEEEKLVALCTRMTAAR